MQGHLLVYKETEFEEEPASQYRSSELSVHYEYANEGGEDKAKGSPLKWVNRSRIRRILIPRIIVDF